MKSYCSNSSSSSTSLTGRRLSFKIFRSTPPSRPNKVGLKCPSIRPQKVSSISMKFSM